MRVLQTFFLDTYIHTYIHTYKTSRSFPHLKKPSDVMVSFGAVQCDGSNCGIQSFENMAGGVYITMTVPPAKTAGAVRVQVRGIMRVCVCVCVCVCV
jgi:hypothetical protein